MIKAVHDGNFTNIRRVAHTINVIVQHALKSSNSMVNEILFTARNIVSHFRRSSRHAEMLTQHQIKHDMPQHKLLQDVSTRSNSTFYMLLRLSRWPRYVPHHCMHATMQTLPLSVIHALFQ